MHSPAHQSAAFHDAVRRWHGRLFRLAARILGSAGDAEDVVQEAMLRCFRSVLRGQLELESVTEQFLVRVVTNLSLNWVRGRERARARDSSFELGNLDGRSEAHVALQELNQLIGQLPVTLRAALVLRELEGLSTREVADALGCSEASVAQRIARARSQLREKVGS